MHLGLLLFQMSVCRAAFVSRGMGFTRQAVRHRSSQIGAVAPAAPQPKLKWSLNAEGRWNQDRVAGAATKPTPPLQPAATQLTPPLQQQSPRPMSFADLAPSAPRNPDAVNPRNAVVADAAQQSSRTGVASAVAAAAEPAPSEQTQGAAELPEVDEGDMAVHEVVTVEEVRGR